MSQDDGETGTDREPAITPEISISGSPAVTEGASAAFMITAYPAPTSSLRVNLSITQSGDFAVSGALGVKTVTVPATGSASYTVLTEDDDADERSGLVGVTVEPGAGYIVVSAPGNSATVTVNDNDGTTPPAADGTVQEVTPEISISGSSAVTEGVSATFRITAYPAPTSPLRVNLSITQSGDFAVSGALGVKTATVPVTGSVDYTVLTVDDNTDEPNGSVTAAVRPGGGYDVGPGNSATVTVNDDDVTPGISISGGGDVTEGVSATFRITAHPAPSSPLRVSLSITQRGDFIVSGALGVKTVTVPATGSASYTVLTEDDDADEPNGSVTATVRPGEGYDVGTMSSATVAVEDDDLPSPVASISGGGDITEGAAASFDITVAPAPSEDISVSLSITQSGNFLRSGQGGVKSVTVGSGGSASHEVLTEDDDADEPNGSVTATIRPGEGYDVGAMSSTTVAVEDNDLSHLERLSLPEGFSISFYSDHVPGARSLAMGTKGTLFVGTRDSFVYALRDDDGDNHAETVRIIAYGLNTPNGVAFRDGDLYVAEINRILRYDDIEDNLSSPPAPVVVTDKFPTNRHHGWKFIRFGPDGKLYVPVGAPCNVCSIDENPTDISYAAIMRMDPDGSDIEVFARGVRNTVGFDWHPTSGQLWFTDNGRDNISRDRSVNDNSPPDELNHAPTAGLHFGFPYCHGTDVRDPDHGSDQRPCSGFTAPKRNLPAHVAALGMRFYTGSMFPSSWRSVIFIAEHGSWNRSVPIGYRVTYVSLDQSGNATSYGVFAQGWLGSRGTAWGRPVDVLVAPDGALLVSDDRRGAVYRISR